MLFLQKAQLFLNVIEWYITIYQEQPSYKQITSTCTWTLQVQFPNTFNNFIKGPPLQLAIASIEQYVDVFDMGKSSFIVMIYSCVYFISDTIHIMYTLLFIYKHYSIWNETQTCGPKHLKDHGFKITHYILFRRFINLK